MRQVTLFITTATTSRENSGKDVAFGGRWRECRGDSCSWGVRFRTSTQEKHSLALRHVGKHVDAVSYIFALDRSCTICKNKEAQGCISIDAQDLAMSLSHSYPHIGMNCMAPQVAGTHKD